MLLLFIHHASDIWELEHKVTFDGVNKLILINNGITEINVTTDIYSDWKEWVRLRDNAKYQQALRVVGGDDIGNSQALGGQYFLINGWRLRTWEGDHTLNINENLRISSDDPDLVSKPNIFVPTLGSYQIVVQSSYSQNTNVVYVDSGEQASGSFTNSDRILLQSISAIVSNLPDSGSLTSMSSDISNILSSTFIAAGSVLSGSSQTLVNTNLSAPNNKYNGMTAIIKNADGGEARQIDKYTLISGTLQLYPELSFIPQAGDSVIILPYSDFRFK
jgi:hypothetical protein